MVDTLVAYAEEGQAVFIYRENYHKNFVQSLIRYGTLPEILIVRLRALTPVS